MTNQTAKPQTAPEGQMRREGNGPGWRLSTRDADFERRFATPIHTVHAFDQRGYRGHATAGSAATVRVAMR